MVCERVSSSRAPKVTASLQFRAAHQCSGSYLQGRTWKRRSEAFIRQRLLENLARTSATSFLPAYHRRAAGLARAFAMATNGSQAHADNSKVIIVGAGVVGSSIAYYLSLHGIAAHVIDRTGVACAASGKAGGFLAYDWSDGSPVGPLQRRSFQLHEKLAASFGAETLGYRRVGALSMKTTVTNQGKSKNAAALKKVVPEWLDKGVLSARRMAGEETTAQVHPEKLTKALLEASKQVGTKLTVGTVQGITSSSDGRVTGVTVDGEDVKAEVVVIAMGPWTKWAASWFDGVPKISAQKAHSIVVEPPSAVTPDCLFLAHTNKQESHADPEVYPRPDGTVYICGEAETVDVPEDPASIEPRKAAVKALQEVGAAISTSLAAGVVLREQACFLPLSPDGTPVIGPIPGTARSLYVASGHSCWGILNAPATGEAVASMIAGQKPPLDMSDFDPSRFSSFRRFRMRRG